MGETREDRVGFIHALATLPEHPGSVPINALVPIRGTRSATCSRTCRARGSTTSSSSAPVAVRPHHHAAFDGPPVGRRESMSESTQALCFLAGANSIFTGDKLLTTGNAGAGADAALFARLGLVPMTSSDRHPGLDPGSTFSTNVKQEQVDAGSSPA
jgi:biotin synthase